MAQVWATLYLVAVRCHKTITRKAVVAIVQARDRTNIQLYCDKFCRAKDAVVSAMDDEWKSSFSLLAPQLIELSLINTATFVAFEVDQELVLSPICGLSVAVRSQRFCIPGIRFDGTHSRHNKYNGVILTLNRRDDNGQM